MRYGFGMGVESRTDGIDIKDSFVNNRNHMENELVSWVAGCCARLL